MEIIRQLIGVKLINGKLKPNFGKLEIIRSIILLLFFIGFLILFVFGIINSNLELIIMPLLGILSCGYILLVLPYYQKSSNYYIEFLSENTLEGFILSYKNKPVEIKYRVDSEGKIAFADDKSKLSCVSYSDGSKMSNFTKYRIINYFGKWLFDNNLMSEEIRVSFEEL